jgi:hypothetical protein
LGAAELGAGGGRALAGRVRESVRNYVGCPSDLADARAEFGDEGKVALLAGRDGVGPPVESAH